jgi:Tol biopolymer transport system component
MHQRFATTNPGTHFIHALLFFLVLAPAMTAGVQIERNNVTYQIEINEQGLLTALRREPAVAPVRSLLIPAAILTEEEIVEAARQFIDDNHDLFQVSSESLALDSTSFVGEVWTVDFFQIHQGFPVSDSSVQIQLDTEGAVQGASTIGIVPEDTVLDTSVTVDKLTAVGVALAECQRVEDCSDSYLRSGHLVLFARDETFVTAWSLEFLSHAFIVDANSAEILQVAPNFLTAAGTITGNHSAWGSTPGGNTVLERLENLNLTLIGQGTQVLIPIPLANDLFPEPIISGDGETIVFVSDVDGDREIYRIDFDGNNLLKLTDNAVDDDQPDVSDDGQTIVFVRTESSQQQIWRISGDGTGEAQVTTDTSGSNFNPTLTDDGGLLAFVSNRDGDHELYIIGSDGSGEIRITFDPGDDIEPSIDAAGTRLAFSSDRNATGGYEVFTADLPGGPIEQVTFNASNARLPSIADNGLGIAALSDWDRDREIFYCEFNTLLGWVVDQKTHNTWSDIDPDLNGDDGYIVYASGRDGDYEIMVYDLEFGDILPITNDGIDQRGPSISDDAARLVYAEGGQLWWSAVTIMLNINGGLSRGATQEDPNFLSVVPLDTTVNVPGGDWNIACPPGENTTISGRLDGLYSAVNVAANAGSRNLLRFSRAVCPPNLLNYTFNPAPAVVTNTSQVNAYYVTDAGYRYLTRIYQRIGNAINLGKVPSIVNSDEKICNAWYNKRGSMTFVLAGNVNGEACPNSAIDSVILHEYGHHLHNALGKWGREFYSNAYDEGIADMNSLFTLSFAANPAIGLIQLGPRTRNYNLQENYFQKQLLETNPPPTSYYDIGGAFAGFANRSRTYLQTDLGNPGITLAENLVYASLLNKQIKEVREGAFEVIRRDDTALGGGGDNQQNNLHDTTPHYDRLRLAACEHGLDAAPWPGFPGEVEISYDHGDAPPPYPTAKNQAFPARHGTIACEMLGTSVSRETDPSDAAFDEDGIANLAPFDRDSDDGIAFPTRMLPGDDVDLELTLSVDPRLRDSRRYNPNDPKRRIYINGWFDWNGDGEWTDLEWVLGMHSPDGNAAAVFDPSSWTSGNPPANASQTTAARTIAVPDPLTDKPFAARFRLDMGEDIGFEAHRYTDASLKNHGFRAQGLARYGEVEDYILCVNLVENGDRGRVETEAIAQLNAHFWLLTQARGAVEQLFSKATNHAFFGTSPPVNNSAANLLIDEDEKIYRVVSEDPILGYFDSGTRSMPVLDYMRVVGENPERVIIKDRLIYQGRAYQVDINALLLPYNRAVMDVVDRIRGKRVRYLLKDCANMAAEPCPSCPD